ncbi:Transposable element Tcb2 transposase [Araneus ventricosus]|uniref:Transposable element Tcb2 transposase n=1 Tax=Araneus ventricosus TaxID=182803 RepID=A0A4Y2DBE3_ARAVE|nr:Transposable element Tcb2 transposase [Araneus ventricosus]
MSRSALPDLLRWRAVGWMGMGLSQADVSRRLNVSRSVVQRLWDQYQSEDSVSIRPVSGRPRVTTPAENRFLALSARRRRSTIVPQLVADHFEASGSPLLRCEDAFIMQVSMQGDQLRVSPSTDDRKGPLMLGKRTRFLDQQQWASELFTYESRFTLGSDSRRLREQRTRYHQSNTLERHSYRGGGIMVWAGISLGGHTDLHAFHGGTLTGVGHMDEILDPYVRPYADAIGNDFILMDDNRAVFIEDYLEVHDLERMEWAAQSPDLNPIEHLWNYFGRQIASLSPPPKSLDELEQGLLRAWFSLPISVSGNLIDSMENLCLQCIQVRGGHIPYSNPFL